MKKSALIAVALIAAFALTSCEKTKKVTLISAVAQLNVSSITDISVPSSFDVVFTNYDTKVAVTATSIDNEASVSNLTPGIYTVTATAISSKDGSAYNFSGSATNVSITEEGQVIPVDVAVVKSSALIFKELYWTGDVTPADPTTGKTSNYFRDQYYEIYNNSQATVYADSLCICTLVPMQSTANSYSWQIDNPENYVFTQLIWQLPGERHRLSCKAWRIHHNCPVGSGPYCRGEES
jgi:predicted small secreted protein